MHESILGIQELDLLLDEERRLGDDLRNQLSVSERKRVTLSQELEDARSLLEAVSIIFPWATDVNT